MATPRPNVHVPGVGIVVVRHEIHRFTLHRLVVTTTALATLHLDLVLVVTLHFGTLFGRLAGLHIVGILVIHGCWVGRFLVPHDVSASTVRTVLRFLPCSHEPTYGG